jgi:hypothetical protein
MLLGICLKRIWLKICAVHLYAVWCGWYHSVLRVIVTLLFLQLALLLLGPLLLEILYLRI